MADSINMSHLTEQEHQEEENVQIFLEQMRRDLENGTFPEGVSVYGDNPDDDETVSITSSVDIAAAMGDQPILTERIHQNELLAVLDRVRTMVLREEIHTDPETFRLRDALQTYLLLE
jgi:hypothetical protein